MKIEEAIVYTLMSEKRGMTTEQLADKINEKCLHERKDGKPVTSNQIYAVVMHFDQIFVKDGRLIRLLM